VLSAAALSTLASPLTATAARADVPKAVRSSTVVSATNPNIRYLGRWGRVGDAMWTVNSGSRVLVRFTGTHVTGLFDQSSITYPPQVYVSVDHGRARLINADRNRIDLTPAKGLSSGTHTLVLVVKDVDERANRWTPRFQSGLGVAGFELAAGEHTLPVTRPTRPRVEFLGDSITQGVRAVGPQIGVMGSDATKDYAWLTGYAFGGNFRQVGFGAQGVTRPGGGGVPAAPAALSLNFAGSPVDSSYVPDAVVVNQGTNDALNGVTASVFGSAFRAYLHDIRARWPRTWIFALRPFGGYFQAEIFAAVAAAHDPGIVYVDTTGWIPPQDFTDGLHPTAVGHTLAARKLARVIAEHTGWRAARVRTGRAPLLAAGGAAGFEGTTTTWRPGSYVSKVTVGGGGPAYHGASALQVTSTTAPLGEWRTVKLRNARLPLPSRAKNLYAFVSVPDTAVTTFDVRVRVVRNHHVYTKTTYNILNLTGFLPWVRVTVDVAGRGPVTAMSISVRAEGASTSGRLSFAVDDIGWTDTSNRTTRIPVPRSRGTVGSTHTPS
jgi:lysophospholipase L1-like esterase